MTNGQELGKDMIVETSKVNEDGTIQKAVEDAKARVDTYPCKIRFNVPFEVEFKNQEELIAWAQNALPNNHYVTVDPNDTEDYEDLSRYLSADYEDHGFLPPALPINTPSKVLALIAYDVKYESMGPGDYDAVNSGDTTVTIVYE